MIIYKIRRKSDGLFSTGGAYPRFNERGKAWKQQGHMTNHINMVQKYKHTNHYEGCEVVSFEVAETEVGTWSIEVYAHIIEKRKEERRLEAKKRADEFAKKQRYEEYKKLKCEFEGEGC